MGILSKLFGEGIDVKNAALKDVVIVVGEESITVQKVLELTFKAEGAILHLFSDSESLSRFIKDNPPGVVLLDASLEPRDGYDLSLFIKSQQQYSKIPVFILISGLKKLDKERLQQSLANGTIRKPFDSQILLQIVIDAINLK